MPPEYAQRELKLPAMASWPASYHIFDDTQRNALRAAEAANRPLLVRGEPGVGKSQIAHAAAVATGRAFLPFVVNSRTEASDLVWTFDAIARLADAHLSAVAGASLPRGLSIDYYVRPGPLWWAFDWSDAHAQALHAGSPDTEPEVPKAWKPTDGCVVLIDEIDKAEYEIPNGLLEVLGNGRFTVTPMQGRIVRRGTPSPLVVVTTNDERELPAAFLRRCMVLNMELPKGGDLVDFLLKRGRLHGGTWATANSEALRMAAEMLLEDRESARRGGRYAPGLAEYLDLLRALSVVGGNAIEQLTHLRTFAYCKQPDA